MARTGTPARRTPPAPKVEPEPAVPDELDFEDGDPFDEPPVTFTRLDDLVGRLVLVRALSSEERESTLPGQAGKFYTSITCDVLVLDGELTEDIEELPHEIKGMFFGGQVITNQLKRYVGKSKMCIGRIGQQESRTRGFGKAWVLDGIEEEDKILAKPLANEWRKAWDD